MKKLIAVAAALVVVAAPATASYANNGHGGGGSGGGGGGSPAFSLSVPSTANVDQSLVQGMNVVITRSATSSNNIKNCSSTVSYTTTAGTATNGTDYILEPATATISKGHTSTIVFIQVLHESENAPDADGTESFTFTISNATSSCKKSSTISNANDVITISDSRVAFHLPVGDEIQISGAALGGCDGLEADLVVPGDTVFLGDNGTPTCGDPAVPVSDFRWQNNTVDAAIVALRLTDFNCGTVSYFSDTTSNVGGDTFANHALVTPTPDPNVFTVDIFDAGGGCTSITDAWAIPNTGNGNLTATVRLVSTPAAPTNFTANPVASDEVDLSWDAVATADYYEIWRTDAGSGNEDFLDTTTDTTYNDTSVSAETEYWYEIKAANDVDRSVFSAEQDVTTLAAV